MVDTTTFFKKFQLLADTPGAVDKMRELVLGLAVRGDLVGQCPRDVPAYETILGAAEAAVEPSDLQRDTPRPGWAFAPLGCLVASNTGGGTPSKQNPAYWDGPIPWASVKDISAPKYLVSTQDSITQEGLENSSTNLIPEGQLIVVTRMGLGKLAINKILVAINQDLRAIRPNEALDVDFGYLLFKSLKLAGKGVTVKGVTVKKLHYTQVAVPPLAEQKRIVAKVDELMALCDRLEAQQQERDEQHAVLARASLARFNDTPTPANLNLLFHKSYDIAPTDLRKTILSLAMTGRLVKQDAADEPAYVLLERAQAEKAELIRQGIVKREPWAGTRVQADELYKLPVGWLWTHVSDVVEKVTVGFVGSMKQHYCQSGVPFLRSQNVRVNRYEPAGLVHITREFHERIKKSSLRPGDVVVTRSGNVGVTCVIPPSLEEANCSDLVIVKRPLALVPAFLGYFINSIASGQVAAKTVGIALTHFNTKSVAHMTVPLPPHAEQLRIVAKVDALMARVDRLEAQLTDAQARAADLMEAVVAELTERN